MLPLFSAIVINKLCHNVIYESVVCYILFCLILTVSIFIHTYVSYIHIQHNQQYDELSRNEISSENRNNYRQNHTLIAFVIYYNLNKYSAVILRDYVSVR